MDPLLISEQPNQFVWSWADGTAMDPLLTNVEVAERLRRPLATIRYWRATGAGPKSARVGGRVLYRQSDVEAWIAAQFDQDGQVSA